MKLRELTREQALYALNALFHYQCDITDDEINFYDDAWDRGLELTKEEFLKAVINKSIEQTLGEK